jgi:uncharacterized integral membrane protein
MRIVVWLVRAFLFLALFAFALNNQQPATVQGFFGFEWRAPTVVVLLLSFAGGVAMAVLAMLPHLWRARREAGTPDPEAAERTPCARAADAAGPASVAPLSQPPREAL